LETFPLHFRLLLYAIKAHNLENLTRIAYILNKYRCARETEMPQATVDDNKRMNLRISPETKAKLVRAAALRNTDLTNFVTQTALREAEAVIEAAEVVRLSARDHARVLELLENPPRPNAKLRAAIAALPDTL
jgi:uncharacterized protein (DUF1778 family)